MTLDWKEIRDAYEVVMPELIETSKLGHWTDPYFIDWGPHMTPIERLMWGHIRDQCVPFYPQMPVGKYFVDFGNPAKKIAIECDGKDFHDPARDRKRDLELLELGWQVIRFTGSECHRMEVLPDVLNFTFFDSPMYGGMGKCLSYKYSKGKHA